MIFHQVLWKLAICLYRADSTRSKEVSHYGGVDSYDGEGSCVEVTDIIWHLVVVVVVVKLTYITK